MTSSSALQIQAAPRRRGGSGRRRLPLTALSFAAAVGFVAVTIVDPYSGAVASPYYRAPELAPAGQTLSVSAQVDNTFTRDGYSASAVPEPEPEPEPEETEEPGGVDAETVADDEGQAEQAAPEPAAPSVAPDPGSAQAEALAQVEGRGWSTSEYDCLVSLWNKESGWNVSASNPSSGAYGIPQALPGNKMASAGGDWQTNAGTQITWGLDYIAGRYGSPCGAWAHSQAVNWY